jgi:hypothetical protein
MKVWLTNNEVAWEIPSGLISRCYLEGYYRPPEPWRVKEGRQPDEVLAFGRRKRKVEGAGQEQLVL